MNLIDSSAWIAYFTDRPAAEHFAKPIENVGQLIVPTIVLYEVFKSLLKHVDENQALEMMAHMKEGQLIDLDIEIALRAAYLNREKKLGMADSIILATAETYRATLWTQDSDFKGMKDVKYFSKK